MDKIDKLLITIEDIKTHITSGKYMELLTALSDVRDIYKKAIDTKFLTLPEAKHTTETFLMYCSKLCVVCDTIFLSRVADFRTTCDSCYSTNSF